MLDDIAVTHGSRTGAAPRGGFSPSEDLLAAALDQLIVRGALVVRFPSGRERRFGEAAAEAVCVVLEEASAVRRLLANPELALGELYVDGLLSVERDDIDGLLALVLQNLRDRGFRTRAAPAGMRLLGSLEREFNGKQRAERNVAHHYDISNEFYRLFLDEDMQYSCAYFETAGDTLEQAQEAKKELIAAKLCLRPGQSVLDIGCGWGGLALHLARTRGVRVRGVTLSKAQLPVARIRSEAQGLASQVEFALEDYRDTIGEFDRIVSVGMFEHVGRGHYDEYFRQIAALLARGRGGAAAHDRPRRRAGRDKSLDRSFYFSRRLRARIVRDHAGDRARRALRDGYRGVAPPLCVDAAGVAAALRGAHRRRAGDVRRKILPHVALLSRRQRGGVSPWRPRRIPDSARAPPRRCAAHAALLGTHVRLRLDQEE